MTHKEQFKPFPLQEYKERYKVSSFGKIWSERKKDYMKSTVSKGHNIILINKSNTKLTIQLRVDELVAISFLGESDMFLNHKDNDLLNDDLDNLEWILITDYLGKRYGGMWKSIKGYEKYYISSRGQVWSSFHKSLIKDQIVSGYKSVNIGYPKHLFKHIHRLVSDNFIPNPNNYPVVNHKDENKMNNTLDNLEWMTSSENRLHSLKDKSPITFKHEKRCNPPDMSKELIWLEGYLITEQGTVYSKKSNRYLKQHLNDNGYYRVYCNGKYFYTHRLVAESYLNTPNKEQTQVNHKNMNRLDNSIKNLEWVSPKENNIHSILNNPNQYKHLQKKVIQLDIKTGLMIKIFDSIKGASKLTNINSGSIVKVCKNIRPSAGGFKWKYE